MSRRRALRWTENQTSRRRLLAIGGMAFLLSGLLASLSLVLVVLALWGLLVLAFLALGTVRLVRRLDARRALKRARSAAEHVPRPPVREPAMRLASAAGKRAAAAPQKAERLGAKAARGYAVAAHRLREGLATQTGRRRAQALNTRGVELRRQGDAASAAEHHRAALSIVQELGDPHAEALTLNNLGLALARAGAPEDAVQHLERARSVLQQLGDRMHEGQVLANLGVVHRREGHTDEAVELLSEALDRLPPESPAYRRVEEQLLRAS